MLHPLSQCITSSQQLPLHIMSVFLAAIMSLPRKRCISSTAEYKASAALTAHEFSFRAPYAVSILGAAFGVFGDGRGYEEGCED
jgi:hypothetical protein